MKKTSLIEEITGLIGPAAAGRLIDRYGGQSLSISGSPSQALIDLLGDEAASLLSERYRATRIYVARIRPRSDRNRRILRLHEDGESVNRLAALFGISDRQIWSILRAEKTPIHKETKTRDNGAEREPLICPPPLDC